jgi:hypothetical protein
MGRKTKMNLDVWKRATGDVGRPSYGAGPDGSSRDRPGGCVSGAHPRRPGGARTRLRLYAAGMRPLLSLSIGRSGTTFLMRLLSGHPQIVARQDYPLEFRPFAFALFPDDPELLASAAPDIPQAEAFSVSDAFALYRAMAEKMGKSPRFFVEKLTGRLDPQRIVTATPDARFLWLVRDPRDVLLSARAFDRKRRFRGFREQNGDSDETVVLKYADGFRRLIDSAERTDARLVRYEQLIGSNGHAALADVFSWLELDTGETIVENAFRAAMNAEDGRHRTSSSPQQSIGRWRSEMSGHLIDLYARHFALIMPKLGYELR